MLILFISDLGRNVHDINEQKVDLTFPLKLRGFRRTQNILHSHKRIGE
jgi:hypothetical protein